MTIYSLRTSSLRDALLKAISDVGLKYGGIEIAEVIKILEEYEIEKLEELCTR